MFSAFEYVPLHERRGAIRIICFETCPTALSEPSGNLAPGRRSLCYETKPPKLRSPIRPVPAPICEICSAYRAAAVISNYCSDNCERER